MKNGFFYTKFLFVLLGLIGFANMKAQFPVLLPSEGDDFTKYLMNDDDYPNGRLGMNGYWHACTGIASQGAYLEWRNVSIPTAGTYDFSMTYSDAGQDRYALLQINDQQPAMVHFGESEDDYSFDWDTNDGAKTVQVYLEAGNNTIRISAIMYAGRKDDGKESTPVFDMAQFTINPSANTIAKLPDKTTFAVLPQEGLAGGTLKTNGPNWSVGNFSAKGGVDNLLVGAGYPVVNNFVEWDVTLPAGKAGIYNVIIDYCNGSNPGDRRFINLLVNDGLSDTFADEMENPDNGSGNWGNTGLGKIGTPYKAMTQFYLHDGLNTVKIIRSSDGSEFSNFTQFELVRIGDATAVTGVSEAPAKISVYSNNGRLYVDSPVAETINVYSANGTLLYNFRKLAGKANFPIDKAQKSVLIVKGNAGWVKKAIL